MAVLDYGALLRIDGKFINKNKKLFMDKSDTGYVLEKLMFPNGEEWDVNGNYFVIAGDENFLLVFYKTIMHVISNGKVIWSFYGHKLSSETKLLEGFPDITIAHLDNKWRIDTQIYEIDECDREFYPIWYGRRGKLYLERFPKKRRYMRTHMQPHDFKYLSNRYLASWEYNGKKYEVIFGYGIEPNQDIWNDIHEAYGFSDTEIEIIDSWFKGE